MNSALSDDVSGHDIIVIGASAGGLRALRDLVAGLSRDLPAAYLAVLHTPSDRDSSLAEILQGLNTLAVRFAGDGVPLQRGTLLIAPRDRHVVVRSDHVRLSSGPRENFWRPSIDVLFRTAAVVHRSRVVGVMLSGTMDDGVAGLAAIRTCGGEALVQDPTEAIFPEMPEAALRQVEGARVMSIARIGAELRRLAETEAPAPPEVPPELELEARIVADDSNFIASLGMPNEISYLNCPECGGPLNEQHDRPARFRCIVGHGFSLSSLDDGLRRQIESSLWVAIRLLQQRSNLGRALSEKEREKGRATGAKSYSSRADEDSAHADVLRRLLMELSGARERGSGNEAEPAPDLHSSLRL